MNSELVKQTAIVIPSYNEGQRVLKVVSRLTNLGFNKIVIVDDGSTDSSMQPLRKLPVTILHHPVNRGAGAATETGLEYWRRNSSFDQLLTIDADTQHNPDDVIRLIEHHINNHADITIGNRLAHKHNVIPVHKRFYNAIANITTILLSAKNINDSQSGLKVMSKNAVYKIKIEHDKYEYCSEILIKAHRLKMKVIDMPVSTSYPEDIKNKGQNLGHGINTFLNLVQSTLFKNN